MAMAIEGDFDRYTSIVFGILKQAGEGLRDMEGEKERARKRNREREKVVEFPISRSYRIVWLMFPSLSCDIRYEMT